MKRHKLKLIGLALFLTGAISYFSSMSTLTEVSVQESSRHHSVELTYGEISMVTFENPFLNVLLNNLIVGFSLSVIGFLTGGLSTALILFWNGYLATIVFRLAFIGLDAGIFIRSILHAPFELLALILLSEIGFSGVYFYTNILIRKRVPFDLIPKPRVFVTPILLLIISAFIETL